MLAVAEKGNRVMEVHALPAAHDGLARYRITMPERPGRYALLEVPADAEDQVGLVELFAGSHQALLDWASVDDEADDDEQPPIQPPIQPPSDYSTDQPPHQPPRQPPDQPQELTTG